MKTKKITPLVAQYQEIKSQYPDVILMIRMGDFYEMFDEDAVTAARELEIVLTSRSQGYATDSPMCGFPHHSAEKYVARLVSKGYRVAICDQLEDPKKTKKLVKRGVTRVVTPGTLLEDGMLDAKANNFLLAIASEPDNYGLAAVDVSTGEFVATQISGQQCFKQLIEEIARIAPAEILLQEMNVDLTEPLQQCSSAVITPYLQSSIFGRSAKAILTEHFATDSLRGFGAEDMTSGLEAAAMLLEYLRKTNVNALQSVTSMSSYSTSKFMMLDTSARRNLEITHSMSTDNKQASLLGVMDKTKTSMGGRLLRKWIDFPLLDVDTINARLDAVEEILNSSLMRSELRDVLGAVQDIERLMSRIMAESANGRDLIALATSLKKVPLLATALGSVCTAKLTELAGSLESMEHVISVIDRSINSDPPVTIKEGNLIRAGFNDELDQLRSASTDGKSWIASLEAQEKERTGIKNLKIGYNSVFGYYIEVTKSNLSLVPEEYVRKQTTTNSERYVTQELKAMESKILGADEKSAELEYQLFCQIRSEVADHALRVVAVARAVAEVDVLSALAELAAVNNYSKPTVDSGDKLIIKAGRHPVVEHYLKERFIPNDSTVDCEDEQLLIITGPNMAGKSTYLRQVALIVLIAQIGSFVPADFARVGVVDRIFTRVGAHDELASGQSTFMVEMNETANILNNATSRSLIVLDEIGRGTSTYDGLSIAWAVAEQISTLGAKTLFATHYHHLNELEKQLKGVKNYRVAVREEKNRIVWLRKIVPGGTDRSYGIEVARLAGLPSAVIDRAQEILTDLENGSKGGKSTGKGVKVAEKRNTLQLSMFEAETSPVVEKLRHVDVSTMTPVEALTVLYDLQKMAEKQIG